MLNAAKNNSLSPVSLAVVRVLLLLVVVLCLSQTRVLGFGVTPQPASGVFESVTPSSIGENYDGCPYDASDSLLAAKGGSKVDDLVRQIDQSGAMVKLNPKTANQEGNVTLDFGQQGRINLRVETHPLTPGRPFVRHANVETVKQVGPKKVLANIHITD